MKILLVLNKTLAREGKELLDSGYYNLYIPLLELGHSVLFFDTIRGVGRNFNNVVDSFKPDLIFCCITGNKSITPFEPIEEIESITKSGLCRTFNWFCDDSWRFDSFNKEYCHKFSVCSTPERSFLQRYHDVGYSNVILGAWYCNEDLYTTNRKSFNVSFCGGKTSSRIFNLQYLLNQGVDINVFSSLAYEDLFRAYSIAKIGLNFTVNNNDPRMGRQMKLRLFEIPCSGSMMLTERVDYLEEYFNIGNEIDVFETIEECAQKLKFYMANDTARETMAVAGRARFLKEHTSKIRLAKIIKEIMAV